MSRASRNGRPRVGDVVRFRRDVREADYHKGSYTLAKKGELGVVENYNHDYGDFTVKRKNPRSAWEASFLVERWDIEVVEDHPLVQLAKAADPKYDPPKTKD